MKRFFFCISIVFSLFFSFCIERNNPFDPRHFSPEERLDSLDIIIIRDSNSHHIDSLNKTAQISLAVLDTIILQLESDSAAIESVLTVNDSIRAHNAAARDLNSEVQRYNDSTSFVDSLRFKSELDSMHLIAYQQDTSSLQQSRNQIQLLRALTSSFVDSVNSAYAPDTIFSIHIRESVLSVYDSIFRVIDLRQSRLDSFADRVDSINYSLIVPYNDSIAAENMEIMTYNQDILYHKQYRDYDPITSTDSIQDGITIAQPGDIFVIGSGTFEPFLQPNNSGTEGKPIVIQGQPDMSTIFSRPLITLDNNSHYIFRNIVFRDSELDGLKLVNKSNAVVFDHCRFENNNYNGLNIIDSDVRILNCQILNNNQRGIITSSDQSNNNYVHIHNSLVAHNELSGIEVTAATSLYITRSTISDNVMHGVYLRGSGIILQTNNSIISYNQSGITYSSPFSEENLFTIDATVLFGNRSLPISGPGDQQPDYIDDINPLFVDRSTNDYSISSNSDLLALENLGITVGYRP